MAIDPHVFKVIIDIEDKAYFTDVFFFLFSKNHFNELWNLREKYNTVSEYPINDSKKYFNQFIYDLSENSRKSSDFNFEIKKFRDKNNIPSHFETVIKKIITSGVINKNDYSRAYYDVIEEDGNWELFKHVIVVNEMTRGKDVMKAFRQFLKDNTINSKVRKKTGEQRDVVFVENVQNDYVKLLFNFKTKNNDQKPSLPNAYKYFQLKENGKSLQQIVLDEIDLSYDDYKTYQKLESSNERTRVFGSRLSVVAGKYIEYQTEYNKIYENIKSVRELISTLP